MAGRRVYFRWSGTPGDVLPLAIEEIFSLCEEHGIELVDDDTPLSAIADLTTNAEGIRR